MSLLFASCDDGDKKNTGPVCGNQSIEAPEVCDGTALGTATCESEGFIGGTLVCAVTCDALDTSGCHRCGDQTISDGETCDGTDLGDEDCESLGFFGGTLACDASCGSFDTSGCLALAPDLPTENECGVIEQDCEDPVNSKCTIFSNGVEGFSWCVPPWGEQSVGEECTRPTGVVGLDTCAPGGYCANFGNPSPIDRTCRAVCNVNDDCSQDENCLNISTQSPRSGVCLASCVPFSDDCTGANHCTWGYDTDLKIILYCDFFGNVGLGGNCSTAKCAEGLLCAAKATGYQCVNACDQDHPCLGDSSCYPFIESAPFSGVCHETDWTCIGGAPWEAPVAPNMTVEFSVMDYVLGTPSANASVKICESTDENCATPLESITTDANGLASLTIPVGAAGFDGFFEVSAPNRVTVLRKFNRPLTAEMIEVQNFGIADQAAYQSTYAPSGFTIDFARGHVEAQILDCLGYSAFGVEFQATGIDANSEIAYLDRLYATDDSLTETSIAGFGLVLNVPGTSTTVTATRASDSMNLATLMVPIRPGCFTEVRLVPEP